MKKIKNILIITIILSLALSVSASGFGFSFSSNELPEPTSNFFVNDFAEVIDDEVETELQAIGEDIYEQTTAQVVVVTVDSLDGYEVGEYALELGREWGVGSADADNGVVLLMSVSDRQVTIQVGYGLEGCLPDGKTGRILDTYAIPYLRNDDFSSGLASAYKAIADVVYEEYGVTPEITYESTVYSGMDSETESILTIVVFIIMTLAVIVILIYAKVSPKNFNGRVSMGPLYRGTSQHYGAFRGDGGSSFRGGGGGFRGGGGSFGGGGSSRGF